MLLQVLGTRSQEGNTKQRTFCQYLSCQGVNGHFELLVNLFKLLPDLPLKLTYRSLASSNICTHLLKQVIKLLLPLYPEYSFLRKGLGFWILAVT